MFIHHHLLVADAAEQAALQHEAAGDIESALCFACKAVIVHSRVNLSVDAQTKNTIEAFWDGESVVNEASVRRGIYDNVSLALCRDISKKLGSLESPDFSAELRIIDELKERL